MKQKRQASDLHCLLVPVVTVLREPLKFLRPSEMNSAEVTNRRVTCICKFLIEIWLHNVEKVREKETYETVPPCRIPSHYASSRLSFYANYAFSAIALIPLKYFAPCSWSSLNSFLLLFVTSLYFSLSSPILRNSSYVSFLCLLLWF